MSTGMKTNVDRVDTGKYMMFAPRPADMNHMMVWDRLWFMIKNVESGAEDIDMLAAWADMWVCKKYKHCVYDDSHMSILNDMEKSLYV